MKVLHQLQILLVSLLASVFLQVREVEDLGLVEAQQSMEVPLIGKEVVSYGR
jgi:hypothetical protein